ncbi:MerR family DNA-binding transcriptional regulator [Streptomyces sp. NPDC055815]
MSTGLRSGQVAAAAGVNVQTLRYYERRGLLAAPERSNGGHRVYGWACRAGARGLPAPACVVPPTC